MNRLRRRSSVGCLLAATLAISGCAPQPTPQALDRDAPRANFQRFAAERARHAGAMQTSAALWLETERSGHLPGVMAQLSVAAPNRVRLVVRSPLGPLLDAAGAGEHLVAAMPRRHIWSELDAAGDSLGVAHPIDLAVTVATASWHPPAAAWDSSTASGGRRWLRWSEDARRVELALGDDGLPREVRISEHGGSGLIVIYESYARSFGTRWPERVRLEDAAGNGRLRLRLESWRALAPSDSASLQVATARGQRVEFAAWREWLDRLVEP